MKEVTSNRVTGQTGYKHVCVSTSKEALERHKRETLDVSFSRPDCGVLCDDETYQWIAERERLQLNPGVLVLINNHKVCDSQYFKEFQELHFYKEIQMI